MKQKKIIIILTLISLLFFSFNTDALAGDDVFSFNPGSGTIFTQTLKTTKSMNMGGMMGRSEEGELITKYSVSKTEEGYSFVSDPVSHVLTMDGNRVENPVLDVLTEVVITINTDNDGLAVSVDGYDKFIEKMRESMPPEAMQSFSSMFNEENMQKKSMDEWNERIVGIVGRKIKVGDSWVSTSKYDLPGGNTLNSYSAFKISEKLEYGGHDCVKIEFIYNTDAEKLSEFVGKSVGEIIDDLGTDYEISDMNLGSITGSGERIIDPSTMLIYYEKSTRSMSMQMKAPGQQQAMEMTSDETREYTFDYE